MKQIWLVAVILVFGSGIVYAQDGTDLIENMKQRPSPTASPERRREIQSEIRCLGGRLDQLYKDCGRYPLSKEGLRALVSKPKTMACHNWGSKTKTPYISSLPKDAEEFAYRSSTGKDYDLRWIGTKSKEIHSGLTVEDFLKTCGHFKN